MKAKPFYLFATLLIVMVTMTSIVHADPPKVGKVRQAIGNAFARSSERSIAGAERIAARADKMEQSKSGLVRKAGRVMSITAGVRGMSGLIKGDIADELLKTPNKHGWQSDTISK